METMTFENDNKNENEKAVNHPSVSEYLTDCIHPNDLAEIFSGAVESLKAFSHISNNADDVKQQWQVLAVFTEILRADASEYTKK